MASAAPDLRHRRAGRGGVVRYNAGSARNRRRGRDAASGPFYAVEEISSTSCVDGAEPTCLDPDLWYGTEAKNQSFRPRAATQPYDSSIEMSRRAADLDRSAGANRSFETASGCEE
jgi:hypothetical protein